MLRAIIDGARKRKIPVIVDPRVTEDFSIYRGATAITPNRFETEVATGMQLIDRDAWRKAAETLIASSVWRPASSRSIATGCIWPSAAAAPTYIPTAPREVYDVTGAGDVVLSIFGLFAIGDWVSRRRRRLQIWPRVSK